MILFKTQMYHSCIKWIKIDDTIEKLYMCEKHQWHLLKIAQNDRNKILKLKLVNKESTVTDVGIGVNVKTTPSVITWLGNVTVVVLLEKLETIVKKVSSSYQKCLKFRMNKIYYWGLFCLIWRKIYCTHFYGRLSTSVLWP